MSGLTKVRNARETCHFKIDNTASMVIDQARYLSVAYRSDFMLVVQHELGHSQVIRYMREGTMERLKISHDGFLEGRRKVLLFKRGRAKICVCVAICWPRADEGKFGITP